MALFFTFLLSFRKLSFFCDLCLASVVQLRWQVGQGQMLLSLFSISIFTIFCFVPTFVQVKVGNTLIEIVLKRNFLVIRNGRNIILSEKYL